MGLLYFFKKIFSINKSLLAVIAGLLFLTNTYTAFAQVNVNMSNGATNTGCNFKFYDSGGSGSNYSNNQNLTHTFCATGTQDIKVQFNQFSTETNYDWLYVYDGPNTSGPLKWAFTGAASGNNFPPVIYSTNGCLTFNFKSDGSTTGTGWDASITCVPKPVYVASDFCSGAPIICDLSNYIGNTSAFYTSSSNETCSGCLAGTSNFSGSLENNSWIAFIAGATSASFSFKVNNCSAGDGVQVGIYSTNCSNSWQLLSPVSYTSGNGGQIGNFTVTANGLVPGQKYYVMVDGFAGDVCDYSIAASNGVTTSVSAAAAPASICAGQSTTLTATAPGTGLNYTWSSTPAGGPYPNTSSITVSPAANTTYTVVVDGYCGSTASATTTVNITAGSVSAWTAPASMCESAPLITLNPLLDVGTTTGGTWSGPGVSSGTFNPATAGQGTHSVNYSVGSGGCSSNTSHNITVTAAPKANWSTPPGHCVGSVGTVDLNTYLSGGSTAGGTWSGTTYVTSGGIIDLSLTPAGSYPIQYLVSSNGCRDSVINIFDVYAKPQATWTPPEDSVCQGFGAITLTNFLDAGTVTGGTWSGTDVSGTTFNPTTVGTTAITYSVTDAHTCSNTYSLNIKVNALPNASFNALDTACINGSSVTLTPTLSGGTFSGLGVNGNTFNPATAGIGNHQIKYIVINVSGCKDSTTKSINIRDKDNASFNYPGALFCRTGTNPSATVTGVQGGVFSGNNGLLINSTTGEINLAGNAVGNYYVYYTTNGNCPATDSVQITLADNPVSADFTYGNDLCMANITLSPSYPTNGVAGVFSSTTGLSIDTATGAIDILASTPGTYVITNNIPASSGCSPDSHNDTLVIKPLPNASFTGLSSSYCSINKNDTLTPTIAGGTFSGQGVTGNIFNPQNIAPGNYPIKYIVTNTDGCIDSSTQTVTVNQQVNISAVSSGGLNTCVGYSDTITASGNATTYSWYVNGTYTSTTNPFILNNMPSGNIVLMVVGSGVNTCPDTVKLNYSILPNTQVNLNVNANQSVCDGIAAAYTASGASTYSWYSNTGTLISTGANFTSPNTTPGTYNYQLIGTSANACPDSVSLSVTVKSKPVVTGSANPAIICSGEPSSLSASTNLGTIVWNNGGANPQTVTPTTSTTYWATATDNGCKDSIVVNVTVNPKPVVTVNANPNTICEGKQSLLTANTDIGTLVWNNGGANPQTVNPTVTTTYWAVSSTANCKDSAIVIVTVNPAPAASPISLNHSPVCIGNPITITANGSAPGVTYTLYDSPIGGTVIGTNGTVTFSPSVAGSYHIYAEAISADGCYQITPRTDSVYVVNDKPTISAPTLTNATCGDPTGAISGITGSSPLVYNWTDQSGNFLGGSADLNNIRPGTYNLSVTDAATGCTSSYSYTINNVFTTHAQFTANDTVFTIMNDPANVVFTNASVGAITYSWNFDNDLTSTLKDPTTQYFLPGLYKVILTAHGNGSCVDYDTLYVRIIDSLYTFYPNVFTPNGDGRNDVFFIRSTEIQELDVNIYNRWGTLIYHFDKPGGSWDGTTLSGLPANDGDYYFILKGVYKDGKPIEEKHRAGYVRLIR